MPYSIFARLPDPATCSLITIILTVSLIAFRSKKVFAKLILHPYSVFHSKEYYRILTSDLVHNDYPHLLLNLGTFFLFGSNLEDILLKRSSYGSWHLIEIFIISQLFANTAYTLTNRNKFENSSAGCSASVMGCLFALMISDPYGTALSLYYWGGIANIYTGLVYILLLVYYSWRKGNDMVNHEIHFYGAIGGVLALMLVQPPLF